MMKKIENIIKITSLLLITISMISIAISLINISKNNSNVYDVNKDGKVSATDYVLIKKYIMNHE